jgi:hypothetical protein
MLVGTALLAGAGLAQAASLSVTPISSRVALGDQIILMLYADFRDDPALGGGFDVFFDSSGLDYGAWIFMAPESVGDDPDFRRQPDVLPGELNGIAFGNFEGMFGRSLIGFLTLDALAVGSYDITLANNEGGPPSNPGPFVSFTTGLPMAIDFHGTTVQVIASAIPLPAAAWLLLGGLAALGLRRRAGHGQPLHPL